MKRERQSLLNPRSVHDMSSEESEISTLLKERGAIHSSLQMADSYLDQAVESHNQLIGQRRRLESSRGKVMGLISRLPVIDSLVKAIGDKRNRDNVIVAVVIAICIFFCIWYVFHSFICSQT